MELGLLIFLVILCAAIFLVPTIWGIVFASRSKDEKLKVWKILLHFFIFGGLTAIVVYGFKGSSNRNESLSKKFDEKIEQMKKENNQN